MPKIIKYELQEGVFLESKLIPGMFIAVDATFLLSTDTAAAQDPFYSRVEGYLQRLQDGGPKGQELINKISGLLLKDDNQPNLDKELFIVLGSLDGGWTRAILPTTTVIQMAEAMLIAAPSILTPACKGEIISTILGSRRTISSASQATATTTPSSAPGLLPRSIINTMSGEGVETTPLCSRAMACTSLMAVSTARQVTDYPPAASSKRPCLPSHACC